MKQICFIVPVFISIIAFTQDISEKELKRNIDAAAIYKAEQAEKKEKAFKEWIKKYPPFDFPNSTVLYEYLKVEISKAFASAGNVQRAVFYANQLLPGSSMSEGLAEIAALFEKKGFNDQALILLQKARAQVLPGKQGLDHREDSTRNAHFIQYSNSLAALLYKLNRFKEAYSYAKQIYDPSNKSNYERVPTYTKILLALNKNKEAFAILDSTIRAGVTTKELRDILYEAYTKVNGISGWQHYADKLFAQVYNKKKEALKHEMLLEKAPDFTIRDLEGNMVSLSDYKNKVVVLDFWATWCLACIQSFPKMQEVVNIYKDSSDIKFFFIHTWDKEPHPIKAARDFLQKNKYSFHVLMDLKDPITQINNVIKSFDIPVIPQKIIIDKNGMIRFRAGAYLGGWTDMAEEMRAMIELANTPPPNPRP
jgi:thiol-disulfide isomerase/thioredoxin